MHRILRKCWMFLIPCWVLGSDVSKYSFPNVSIWFILMPRLELNLHLKVSSLCNTDSTFLFRICLDKGMLMWWECRRMLNSGIYSLSFFESDHQMFIISRSTLRNLPLTFDNLKLNLKSSIHELHRRIQLFHKEFFNYRSNIFGNLPCKRHFHGALAYT